VPDTDAVLAWGGRVADTPHELTIAPKFAFRPCSVLHSRLH
jgi:hypothetical protein